jgi:hypothetical protein
LDTIVLDNQILMKDFLRTLIIGVFVVGIIIGLYFLFFNQQELVEEKEVTYTEEELIKMAQDLFNEKKQQGIDMENGPCLTNELIPGWVVDVAHSPRQTVDNQMENQCLSFREGKAEHFIELDLEGNLIKIK